MDGGGGGCEDDTGGSGGAAARLLSATLIAGGRDQQRPRQPMLAVASGDKTWAERWGLHNDLVLFNPAPIT